MTEVEPPVEPGARGPVIPASHGVDASLLEATRLCVGRELSERHREVLDVALDLIAERGYAGASLRLLARRLGMAQPSLYHYFRNKEELVCQVIECFASDAIASVGLLPEDAAELPDRAIDIIVGLWQDPRHVKFVRTVFAVSRLEPEFGRLFRELVVERTNRLERALCDHYARREGIPADDLYLLIRMVTSAVEAELLESCVLFDLAIADSNVLQNGRRYAAIARTWLLDRRRERAAAAALGQ